MQGLILCAAMAFWGAFEYRTGDPQALFPVQAATEDCMTPAVVMNPSYLVFADSLLLNSNAGRPYSEKVLTTGSSSVQYGGGGYGFQFYWNCFGSDFYREHTVSLKAGYSLLPFLHVGISGNLYLLSIRTEDICVNRKSLQGDYALLLTPVTWLNMAFIQSSVSALLNGRDKDMIYPERSAGILVKPGRGFSVSWNIMDTAVEKVNTFNAVINPSRFMSVRGGYCRENSSLAASLSILAGNFFISYGLRLHPYLGYTHSIGITYAFNPEIETLDYGKPFFSSRSKKRINIQTASAGELKKIDGLRPLCADRIILFRQKIGPVTEKSFMQIGLTPAEIKSIEESVYGLERIKRNNAATPKFRRGKKFKKIPPKNERIKEKFRKLIGVGIPAYTAISYSELSETLKTSEFRDRLWKDPGLDDGQKKFVEKICSE